MEALRVGNQVNCDDLPVRDREAEYDLRTSMRSPHESHRSIHERQLGISRTPRELLSHGWRTTNLP